MNTANKITLVRVILIPVFVVICYLSFPYSRWVALVIFILASFSDFLDGYIARTYNQITDFGKFLDPIADKLLVTSAMLIFVLVAVDNGRVIAAGWSGKVKTASTMVCICVLLVFDLPVLNLVCNAVILVTTVYSGIEYFIRNRDVINPNK